MTEQAARHGEPSWVAYLVAAAVAAPAGYLLPSIWYSSTLLGGGLAVGAAVFGVFSRENVGEGIVMLLILGGMFALLPKTSFVTAILLPPAAGLVIGHLTVGVWKELR